MEKSKKTGNKHNIASDKATSLYQDFILEREEILKHKWLESEKKGEDVGFDTALLDWVNRHQNKWRENRKNIIDVDLNKDNAFVEPSVCVENQYSQLHKKVFKFDFLAENENEDGLEEQFTADKSTRVLVFAHDDISQGFLKDLLNDYGFTVDVASTHVETVLKFRKIKHAIILVDMHFSNLNLKREGLQAIRDTREFITKDEQPTVIAIGHLGADAINQQICLEAGSDFFFEKPIHLNDLVQVLNDRGLLKQKTA